MSSAIFTFLPTPTSILPLKGRKRSASTFPFKGKAGMGMGYCEGKQSASLVIKITNQ
jgi:hypothetical protein